MVYNACQIGVNVNLSDLSLHTLMAVNEYAAKLLSNDPKDKNSLLPKQSLRDIRKQTGKNYG